MIFKIARNELRNLFYSPVAWFITLVFFITCAVLFTNKLYDQAVFNELLVKSDPTAMKILSLRATLALYSGLDGLLPGIVRNLHLFIPLLTMGLINREINNGSIRLLYSSPIQNWHIVFGKYLGLMTYNLLLLAIVGVFIATGFFAVSHIDYGPLLSASFGFFLMLAAYSAVGLYMSSLTTYQIVAALGTFLILFTLSRIGGLWQQYDFVRDITWLLSMEGRLQKLMVGLIRSKDVIYYLSIIFIFLSFTLIRLQKGRQHSPWYLALGKHLSVLVIALTVGYIGSRSRYTKYWDTSATKVHTIPVSVQEIISRMDKDSSLEVTLYTNLVDSRQRTPMGLPVNRNGYLEELWDPYLRFKPDIQFRYEYYYDNNPAINHATLGPGRMYREFPGKSLKHIAEEHAKLYKVNFSLFKSPEEMRKQIGLDPEGYALVMQLKYKGKTEFVRFGTGKPGVQQIGGALKRLINEENPDLAYVYGELERDIYSRGRRDYGEHTILKDNLNAFINTGFRIDTINLHTRDIPRSVTTIVLADPRQELSEPVLNKLKAYIDEGKNMLILGEPDKQHELNPLLQELGVELLPGQLVEPKYTATPEKILAKPAKGYRAIWGEENYRQSITLNLPVDRPVEFPGTAAFKYRTGKYDIEPVFETMKEAWLKATQLVSDSAQPVFNAAEGDSAGIFSVALKLTRNTGNREQRILIWGDADLFSNWNLPATSNLPPMLLSWLHYGEFPIDKGIFQAKDVMKMPARHAKWVRIVYVYIVPVIILAGAVLLLKRRNRK